MNKTITVYFSGTSFPIDDQSFLAAYLCAYTQVNESQIKMGFSGSGVDYGFSGAIFGSGLDEQCKKVIDRVVQEIQAGHHITLNVYGHSRGGIAALLLAKQLSNFDEKRLAIHLALLDPVPGNFITIASIDPNEISLANKAMDLSYCKPLRKVLALYPHIPLPAIACHAPSLASYPVATEVEEEVLAGCHAELEYLLYPLSRVAACRVAEFLVKNGTEIQTCRNYNDAEVMKQTYLSFYRDQVGNINRAYSRDTHCARGVVIVTTPGARYLNNHHRALEGGSSQEAVCLSIQPEKPSWFKRFCTNHPLVGQTIKWALSALTIVSLLYFTGGLAAIPLLAPIVVQLGVFSPLVFSPVMGGALVALWYGALKPLLSCSFISQFFYPHYAIREIEAPPAKTQDSTIGLLESFQVNHATVHSLGVDEAPSQSDCPLFSASKEDTKTVRLSSASTLSSF